MAGEKGIRCESGAMQSLCTGAVLHNHWETGKGKIAKTEVRRPALAWNLKSAVYGLTFLQICNAPWLFCCGAADAMVKENGCGCP